jgi:hypothetical protein
LQQSDFDAIAKADADNKLNAIPVLKAIDFILIPQIKTNKDKDKNMRLLANLNLAVSKFESLIVVTRSWARKSKCHV